jgi:UDP-N-acetylglucosamine 2-epimerase (non-hydrolysing)
MKFLLTAGARPNFMKIAPIIRVIHQRNTKSTMNAINYKLVHTGQHYDREMSEAFFHDLELPSPDIFLGVGSGSHSQQVARVMMRFEEVCLKEKPDAVVVVGDVNSTLACALTAAKLGISVAHVEAGLRSFDRTMPEEINRVATDALSDFLFTTEKSGNKNLINEGISKKKIFFVGNVMIDTLLKFKAKAKEKAKIKLKGLDFALLTLHRPTNVDNKKAFKDLLQTLRMVSKQIPIIFPAHPRTQKQIRAFGYEKYFNVLNLNSINPMNPSNPINSINLSGPLPYLEFINLMANAKMVFTDSGGIQEETTILGVPCLTIRQNTERPVTIEEGTNILVGNDRTKILKESFKILNGKGKRGKIPKFWDGRASERIVKILVDHLSS